MTEFELIERYFTRATDDPNVLLGIGDDAAVLAVDGALAVTVDTLVEGVHFPAGTAADAIGYRLLAVNLSDLAAMGAEPRWCTLALSMPAADETWLAGFVHGFFGLAERFGVSLVGGNLARGPLNAVLQLMGSVPASEALRRSGAKAGDEVYVSGTLGDAAAGLSVLGAGSASQSAAHARLAERFLRPSPRIALGLGLRGLASAAIDVSDGLAADFGHLCRASACGAVIDVERLPLSTELRAVTALDAALAQAMAGGDDYELCFTAAPESAVRIAAAAQAAATPVCRIGRIVAGTAVEWRRSGASFAPPAGGYLHF